VPVLIDVSACRFSSLGGSMCGFDQPERLVLPSRCSVPGYRFPEAIRWSGAWPQSAASSADGESL